MIEENEVIDLVELGKKVFSLFLRTWLLLILLLAVGVGGMCFYTRVTYHPMYQSKVSFAVSREISGEKNYQYNRNAMDSLAVTLQSMLNSEVMTTAVCEELETKAMPATLHTERVGTTNLFTVYARGRSAEKAKATMDAFLNNYPRVFRMSLVDIDLEIIEQPELAKKPYNHPGYFRNGTRGALAAAVLYAALIGLYAFLRRTIQEEEDVRQYLHSKCIGTIPYMKSVNKEMYPLITKDHSRYFQMAESLRTIRMQLEQKAAEEDHRTFLFTSCAPNEGKSTIASNIAVSLAQKGCSVVLVDLDFRNPTIRHIITGEPKEIKEYDGFQMEEYWSDAEESLFVCCGVQDIEHSTEILSSRELEKLISRLKWLYEYVIIDSLPLQTMEDTLIAAKYADEVIYVLKEDGLSVSKHVEALEMLNENGVEPMGCIINGSRTSTSYYGRYGYGYGYRYSYGYMKR